MSSDKGCLREIAVGVAVTVIGSAVIWYLGLTEPRTPNIGPSTSTAQQPTVQPNTATTVQPPPEPQRTNINIAYAGDMHACVLSLSMTVGGQSFAPLGNLYPVSGIPVGPQNYVISGTIQCPLVGACEARGQGTINVSPGTTYNVIWQNTEYAKCTVILQ